MDKQFYPQISTTKQYKYNDLTFHIMYISIIALNINYNMFIVYKLYIFNFVNNNQVGIILYKQFSYRKINDTN